MFFLSPGEKKKLPKIDRPLGLLKERIFPPISFFFFVQKATPNNLEKLHPFFIIQSEARPKAERSLGNSVEKEKNG